ncbi:ferredoxin family protein [Zavarzinia sp.]|uniref:4Fe-4S dicluster domain-containing protein n=1 Tax=Zavarzinia sp. TaxID=2027920 RepID=UPI00356326EB
MAGTTRDLAKAKRAAAHPKRPGKLCRAPAGTYAPVVDHSRCEGKADCIAVCPHDVFELGRLTDAEFAAMGFFTRLKMSAHGRKTVRTPKAEDCLACGLCVVACPERAIALVELAAG